jgi:hypothetical protein
MRNGKDDDSVGLHDVPDREREACQQKSADASAFADAGPEWPGRRALCDGVQPALDLISEVAPEPWKLLLVPVAGRGEVGSGSRVEADSHALPAAPAVDEAGADDHPVLGGDRARTCLTSTQLQLRDPGLRGVGVGAVVEAHQQLVSDPGALPNGEGEGVGEQISGFGCHAGKYSLGGLTSQVELRRVLWTM